MVPPLNEGFPFSFALNFLLFGPQSRGQLSDVVMKVVLDLFEKAKHEEDFVVHEKRSKDECCSEHH